MHEQLALAALEGGVHQQHGLGGVPIVQVVRRELKVPELLSGFQIERQNAVGEEVVAQAFAAIGIRVRVADSPVEHLALGIVAAREPRGAAAEFDRAAAPGFPSGFALARNCPVAPRELAGGGLVSGQEPADAVVGARHAADDQVAGHQRRRGRAVVLRLVGHVDIPAKRAGEAVERDHVSVVGGEEYAVAQKRHAAVGALGGIRGDIRAGRARPRVAPDFRAATRIQGADLIGAAHVHHPIDRHRCSFQAEIRKGVHPLQ